MNKIATIAGLAAAATTMTASADLLLEVDLTVADQITISATSGLASASASASNFTGFLLADFLGSAGDGPGIADGVGDLTSANDPSDLGPSIFNGSTSFGVNIWNYSTNSTVSVTAGTQAFSGSATWTVSTDAYNAALAGAMGGTVWFNADTDAGINGGGTDIGTWARVPAPGSMALLGLGGIVAGRRRR